MWSSTDFSLLHGCRGLNQHVTMGDLSKIFRMAEMQDKEKAYKAEVDKYMAALDEKSISTLMTHCKWQYLKVLGCSQCGPRDNKDASPHWRILCLCGDDTDVVIACCGVQ